MTLLLAFIVSPLFDLAVLDFAVAGLVLLVLPFGFLAIFSHPPCKQIHRGLAGQFIFPNSIFTSK
jgi:hypothetical protein